jgi:bisphosphoglycerate-dependent phosphoglycerate mutase
MGAAMVSHKKDPKFSPDNERMVSQLQGLAYLFAKRFGKDKMPKEFQEYAVRPPMVKLAPAPEAASEEGAPAPEKAEAPGAEEMKAEKKK